MNYDLTINNKVTSIGAFLYFCLIQLGNFTTEAIIRMLKAYKKNMVLLFFRCLQKALRQDMERLGNTYHVNVLQLTVSKI